MEQEWAIKVLLLLWILMYTLYMGQPCSVHTPWYHDNVYVVMTSKT